MDFNDIKKCIEEHGIDTVELGFADIYGVLRGKRLPARHFLKHIELGTALAKAPFAWDVQCGVYDDTKIANFNNGYPDMVAKPILSTFRKIPWREGSAFALCDLYDDHGEPIDVAPREVLKKVLKRAEGLGFRPLVGSELEFYLLNNNKQPLFQGIQCYSLLKGAELEYVIKEMRTGLEEFGIELEAFHIEYGPAQIEVIPEYTDALKMADNTVLIKNAVKEIARKHGLYATFMAKPWAEESGNGYHVHQSLWDRELKVNYFNTDEKITQNYLAGLVQQARDFMVFASPSINSYKRFKDDSFAPTKVTWGDDNRTVSTRSLLGNGNSSRFEHRTGSADANPYLIIAASIAAGLYGIENELIPPPITRESAYLTEAQLLPRNLRQALSYLEGNEVAKEYFGEDFVKLFLTLEKHEVELFDDAVTDWERDRYLEMI
ncbi:MAG: Glutamine synthetase [Pelotomaculum sp. PtaU1.Bin035]|nr:MAG: Glutamine synthetase [Pelotomaculum sp. PtaU1.Bin035]